MIVTDEKTVLLALMKIREVQAVLLDAWARHPSDPAIKQACESLQDVADSLQKDS